MTRRASVSGFTPLISIYSSLSCQEGDHIGLMRKASGALHFYINGIDQGETFAHFLGEGSPLLGEKGLKVGGHSDVMVMATNE